MAPITVVLAVGAPLLHARMSRLLIDDPGVVFVHDAVSGTEAARQIAYWTPRIVLCDRHMLAEPDFNGMRFGQGRGPCVVLVTVSSDVPRATTGLTIAGTVPVCVHLGN